MERQFPLRLRLKLGIFNRLDGEDCEAAHTASDFFAVADRLPHMGDTLSREPLRASRKMRLAENPLGRIGVWQRVVILEELSSCRPCKSTNWSPSSSTS